MKGIPLKTWEVQAILNDQKTVIRRVVKPQPEPFGKAYIHKGAICTKNAITRHASYRPGDILYVQETWAVWSPTYGTAPEIIYKADGYSQSHKMKWRPSIHMRREAARIFLRVTDVKVERLQDITEEQALAEGVPEDGDYPLENPVYCPKCKGEGLLGAIHPVSLGYMEVDCPYCDTPQKRFSNLWDSTLKPKGRALYGWDANPWVWVIEFERISEEEVNNAD